MALQYKYTDTFLTDDIENLEEIETSTIKEVSKITDTEDAFLLEKLVVNRVYMLIAKENLEGDGYKEKYDLYEKEFKHYRSLSSNATPSNGVGTISLYRS